MVHDRYVNVNLLPSCMVQWSYRTALVQRSARAVAAFYQYANPAHARQDAQLGDRNLYPGRAKVFANHLGDVLGQRFQQQEVLLGQRLAQAFHHHTVVNGVADIIGMAGHFTGNADFQVDFDGLRIFPLPLINTDNGVGAYFAQENDVHCYAGSWALSPDTVKSEAFYSNGYTMTTTAFAFVVAAYLLGSLSFAVIVSKAMGMADPRSYGSGNPGATNVLRSGKKTAAVLTLLGDGAKGWVAVALTAWFGPRYGLGEQAIAMSALAVLIGHMWPVFFGFKGGKGVATAVGVLFGFNVWLALAAIATWLFMAFVVKISSLSAIVACVMVPVYAYFIVQPSSPYFGTCIIIAILVIHRHKSNLIKLLTGQEGRIGEKAEKKGN